MKRWMQAVLWCTWSLYMIQGSSSGYVWKSLQDFVDVNHGNPPERATARCLAALREKADIGPLKPISVTTLEQSVAQSTGEAPRWYSCYPALSEGFDPYKR